MDNKSNKLTYLSLISLLSNLLFNQVDPSRITTFRLGINPNKTQKQMIECSEKLFNDKTLETHVQENSNTCFIKNYSKEKRAKREKWRKWDKPL
jgi:hypothetical protein